jgi:HK97 family phage prohead protease
MDKPVYKPECHAFKFQIDQENSDLEAGRFRGIAAVFGSVVDTYPNPTIIEPGAFEKAIADRQQRRSIKILFQHNEFETWIGLPTLLEETDEGLAVEVSLNQTQRGQDVANAIRHAKAIGQLDAVELSIGFDAVKKDWQEHEDGITYRHVLEIRLWEISIVNFGADRQTVVTEAASLQSIEPSPQGTLEEPRDKTALDPEELEKYEIEIAEGELAILSGR